MINNTLLNMVASQHWVAVNGVCSAIIFACFMYTLLFHLDYDKNIVRAFGVFVVRLTMFYTCVRSTLDMVDTAYFMARIEMFPVIPTDVILNACIALIALFTVCHYSNEDCAECA